MNVDSAAVVALARDARVVVLNLVDENLLVDSQPMTILEIDDENHFWFLRWVATRSLDDELDTRDGTLTFGDDKHWVSMLGRVVPHPGLAEALSCSGRITWMADGTATSPLLLEVTPTTAYYWASPGRTPTAVRMAVDTSSADNVITLRKRRLAS